VSARRKKKKKTAKTGSTVGSPSVQQRSGTVRAAVTPNQSVSVAPAVKNETRPKKDSQTAQPKKLDRSRVRAIFLDGLLLNNPVLTLMLGLCSALAVTTTLLNAIGMGIATTLVLVISNVAASFLQKRISGSLRLFVHIAVIAVLVMGVDLLMQALTPGLSKSLGIFVPLIAVNGIILARAEAFASGNALGAAAWDGVSMGVGYTVVLCIMGTIRELLGAGTLLGHSVFGSGFQPVLYLALPCGGFFTLACLAALAQHLKRRLGGKRE